MPSRSGRVPSNDGLGGMDFQEDMGCKYARYTRGQVLRQAACPVPLAAIRQIGSCLSADSSFRPFLIDYCMLVGSDYQPLTYSPPGNWPLATFWSWCMPNSTSTLRIIHQPSCRFHPRATLQVLQCMRSRSFVFFGDSMVRQLFNRLIYLFRGQARGCNLASAKVRRTFSAAAPGSGMLTINWLPQQLCGLPSINNGPAARTAYGCYCLVPSVKARL